MSSWVCEELETADLGDKRLNARFGMLLETVSGQPSLSIPAACKGLNETIAAYRFFANQKVTPEKILAPHRDATLARIAEHPVVLLLQDTTELDYSGKQQTQGLGHLSYERRIGLLKHLTLAVTPQRLCLGVTQAKIWGRSPKAAQHKSRPIEDKESYRWIEGYRHACEIASQSCQTSQIISIADREGDLYEMFVEAQTAAQGLERHAQWIIRSCQNRALNEKSQSQPSCHEKLHERMAHLQPLGEIELNLPARDKQPARVARLAVRSSTLELKAPYRKGVKLPPVTLNAVWVSEIDAPAKTPRLEWLLLTSLDVRGFEQAVQVAKYYACRWQIEIFFKILKSGCRIEQLQLQSDERLKPCIALYLIVAWRALFVTMLGRSCPDLPCSLIFEPEEWQSVWVITQKQAPPDEPPSLQKCVAMIASLGGYLERKGDGPPGPMTLWIGLQRTKDFAAAWLAFGPGRT